MAKTEIKLVNLKMQLGWETVYFYHVDTSLFSSIFDVDSIGLTSSKIKLMPCASMLFLMFSFIKIRNAVEADG